MHCGCGGLAVEGAEAPIDLPQHAAEPEVITFRAMALRRIFLILLCALLGIGAPLASSFAAGTPCATIDGSAPCDCEDAGASDCAAACSTASVVGLIAVPTASLSTPVLDEAACLVQAGFTSQSGPPGLQPPR
jgi:hypothetical protein